jgi:hypothetical protein
MLAESKFTVFLMNNMRYDLSFFKAYVYNQIQTTIHKCWVAHFILKFCGKLLWRALVHDITKYGSQEAYVFASHVHELKSVEYGTPAYAAMLTKLPCLKHHYAHNSHHPQHYPGGYREMSALDRIEMVADWCAAVRRNKDGCVWKSLKLNKDRFQYDDRDLEWLTLVAQSMSGACPESHKAENQ